MKKERQGKIIELIGSKKIETQDELQQELVSAGFDVTQATVSRDIKELRIVKMLDSNGVYCYAVSGGSEKQRKALKYEEIFANSVISAAYSVNNVVIKCHPGMAQGACASLDLMNLSGILGTLAGDDTVLIISKTENDAESICGILNGIIG